ncbi:tyrosine-type recombinase/integrase [Rhodococcus hoagii]|nr:tyrosine-type recombinase/integrase [Prescottella equi]
MRRQVYAGLPDNARTNVVFVHRLALIPGRPHRLGLDPAITWHSLRHFYASALIHAGASPKTVQERLGHESAETTLEVYTHLWPGEGERTRSAVDAALMRDQCGTGSSSDAESDETVPAELDSTGTGGVIEMALGVATSARPSSCPAGAGR